ncbi:pentatricopeptide repeat-containing protein At3g48250, chloroplastic-like [Silene latifolia]|uniref:pentatricopeptide repeat-containing protein At3g48250, chloroplastic-like n=1 Tax=Silene latifolia TaxID=37657 RepID=UPI003D773800
MNRAKLLRLSTRLVNSLTSTRKPLTQVNRFSQLTQFPPFPSPTNPYICNKSFNLHHNFFFSSKVESFIDLISSNDWYEEIEIKVEEVNPNLTHESIVYALLKLNKNPKKCLDFFKWVCVRKGFDVSYVHYSILLKSLACKGFVDNFWVVALEMKEKGFYIDNQVFLHVTTNLKRDNLVDDALHWSKFRKLLCKVDGRSNVCKYVVDLILEFDWNEEVEEKLKKMVSFPVEEDFVIRVLRELWKQPLKAIKFFEWVAKFGGYEHNSVTYNGMVKVLAQPEFMDEFWALIGWMKIEGFEVDLDSYQKISKLRRLPIIDAVKFFEFMMDGPYKLSLPECTSLLKRLSHDSNPDMDLVNRVVNKFVASGNTLTKMVYDGIHRILCNTGRLDEAKKIVQEMSIAGYKPDNITYSQEVFGLCSQRRFEEASNLLDQMEAEGCVPDIKTWTILLQGYCAATQVDQALSCFYRMLEKNVNPDPEMLETLLYGFLAENKLFGGYRFLVEMVKEGRIKPWKSTYKLMIGKLAEVGKFEEALDLLRLMKKQDYPPFPDPILQYVSKSGTVENAKKLLWELRDDDFPPSSATFVWVIKSFFEKGRESEAMELIHSSPYRVRRQKAIREMFPKQLPDETNFSLIDEVH